MTSRSIPAVLTAAALALAACGGSSDDGGGIADNPGVTEQDSGANERDSSTNEQDSGDGGSGDDVTGDGSNDEAQQNLDDAGLDIDLDALEDTVAGFSTGDGGGVVNIADDVYTFEAQICVAQGASFTASGPGTSAAGVPAWVDISYSNDFDFDGDGASDVTVDLSVEVGKTEVFGSGGDDEPSFSANKIDSATLKSGEDITFTFDGNTISGAGPIADFSGVAVPFGETVPMTFDATCT
jgi:hypothetical protein